MIGGWKKTRRFQLVIDGKKRCKACDEKLPLREFKKNRSLNSGRASICFSCSKAFYLTKHRKLKQEFVDAYGGECQCCGEKRVEFLTLEHTLNDGVKDRERLKRKYNLKKKIVGAVIYKILKYEGWPKDKYTVLCWNCNCARKFGRTCPHERQYANEMTELKRRSTLVKRCRNDKN